ncbi:hypothetical protein [Pseudomonas sp. 30_B]|nr:hypothetical protein [Pseudomonas sp. 30_B]
MSLVIRLWKKRLWKNQGSVPSFPTVETQAAHPFRTGFSLTGSSTSKGLQ